MTSLSSRNRSSAKSLANLTLYVLEIDEGVGSTYGINTSESYYMVREAAKKVFFNDPATKRGGGAWPLRKKNVF